MAARRQTHTRIVSWLKVGLPLIALGLLSTLFLFSAPSAPPEDMPFADSDLTRRAAEGQVTAPVFSGMTDAGDVISLRADTARPAEGEEGDVGAAAVSGDFRLADGSQVTLTADRLDLSGTGDTAHLSGNVRIQSSTGYSIAADSLSTRFSVIDIESEGPVSGTGPAGNFTAGKLRITGSSDGGATQLLFTDGVKLVYDPKIQD